MTEHAPGWYEHDGERRYWDGTRWTHSTSAPPPTSTPSPTSASASPTTGAATPASPPPPPSSQVVPYTAPTHGQAPPPGAGQAPFGQQSYGQQSYAQPPHVGPAGAMPAPRKDPAISLILSLFIPGVGSMVNGDVGAGVGFLGLYIFGLVLVICLGWILIGFIGLPLMVVAWGWGMYHAYQGAVELNRRNGYQS